MKIRPAGIWMIAACAIAVLPTVQAQSYPSRAITLVVGAAPGDAADIASRVMAEELAKYLKTPVVAVNRPGAGGLLAADSVAKGQKDGYTILFANNSAITYWPVFEPKTMPYDPNKDLVPLGLASRTPLALAVRSDAPYRTFKDLVDFAKKNPGSVRIGTPGAGSLADFCIEVIKGATDAQFTATAFKGGAPAVTALRGGHIEAVLLALGALGTHIKSGTVRALVVSNKFPEFPDIPTMPELGYRQNIFGIWFAFFAPSGVPVEVTKVLAPAIQAAVEAPAVATRLLPLGVVQDYATPEKLAAEIREEYEAFQTVAKRGSLVK